MVYCNQEAQELFPRECHGDYIYKMDGNKIKITKRLDGSYISNNVSTDYIRIFVEGKDASITVSDITIYRFGNKPFKKGNFLDSRFGALPITAKESDGVFVDVPINCMDETIELTVTATGDRLYTIINGTISNITQEYLKKIGNIK